MTTYDADMADYYSNYMTDEQMDEMDAEQAEVCSDEDAEADAFSMMEDAAMESSLLGADC